MLHGGCEFHDLNIHKAMCPDDCFRHQADSHHAVLISLSALFVYIYCMCVGEFNFALEQYCKKIEDQKIH